MANWSKKLRGKVRRAKSVLTKFNARWWVGWMSGQGACNEQKRKVHAPRRVDAINVGTHNPDSTAADAAPCSMQILPLHGSLSPPPPHPTHTRISSAHALSCKSFQYSDFSLQISISHSESDNGHRQPGGPRSRPVDALDQIATLCPSHLIAERGTRVKFRIGPTRMMVSRSVYGPGG
ncbi:hypothetical protein B0H17DRAFT_1136726 [Mycena rosella]|uniref:Uncharacterized protein n=1 Tax=Mycena rosella TaxID=1033263 RepID=A0AAD7DD98_MYCRO|nr:hypothetical protein B0H17DRAFT_1136726 [Mycena rosella]